MHAGRRSRQVGQVEEREEASHSKTLDSEMKVQYLKREKPVLGHVGHQRAEEQGPQLSLEDMDV